MKIKLENNSGLNGIQTHDPAIPLQRSNQLNYQELELVIMWIRDITVKDDYMTETHENHIFKLRNKDLIKERSFQFYTGTT